MGTVVLSLGRLVFLAVWLDDFLAVHGWMILCVWLDYFVCLADSNFKSLNTRVVMLTHPSYGSPCISCNRHHATRQSSFSCRPHQTGSNCSRATVPSFFGRQTKPYGLFHSKLVTVNVPLQQYHSEIWSDRRRLLMVPTPRDKTLVVREPGHLATEPGTILKLMS